MLPLGSSVVSKDNRPGDKRLSANGEHSFLVTNWHASKITTFAITMATIIPKLSSCDGTSACRRAGVSGGFLHKYASF